MLGYDDAGSLDKLMSDYKRVTDTYVGRADPNPYPMLEAKREAELAWSFQRGPFVLRNTTGPSFKRP